jgi:hypothetical protein
MRVILTKEEIEIIYNSEMCKRHSMFIESKVLIGDSQHFYLCEIKPDGATTIFELGKIVQREKNENN